MVSKLRITWKQTVQGDATAVSNHHNDSSTTVGRGKPAPNVIVSPRPDQSEKTKKGSDGGGEGLALLALMATAATTSTAR